MLYQFISDGEQLQNSLVNTLCALQKTFVQGGLPDLKLSCFICFQMPHS